MPNEPDPDSTRPPEPERYKPLPGLFGIPGHLLGLLSPRGRRIALVGIGLFAVGVVAGAAILIPKIQDTKKERAEREAAEKIVRFEARVRDLRAEQRVKRGRGQGEPVTAPPPVRVIARRSLLADLRADMLRDSRARTRAREFDHPIRRIACYAFPATADQRRPETVIDDRVGRYECIAVTSDIPVSEVSGGGVIGYPFRVKLNWASGRYAWCKISGRAGEGAFQQPLVGVPVACGGTGAVEPSA